MKLRLHDSLHRTAARALTSPSSLATLLALSLSSTLAAQPCVPGLQGSGVARQRARLAQPSAPFARDVFDRSQQNLEVWTPHVPVSNQEMRSLSPAEQAEADGAHPASTTSALKPMEPALKPVMPTLPPGATVGGDLEEVAYSSDEAGLLWVRGRTYKASFGAHGIRYIPFLGSDAPRNFPLDMRVVEASVAGEALDLELPSVARTHDRVAIDRGPLRTEYVPGLTGVEQLFVLDAPLAESGDLVVKLDVQTELVGSARARGHAFEGPFGGVHYGEVFVLDAAGHRMDTPALLSGETLEIRVPASFLAAATYPLAIDPLITTSTIDATSAEQRHPDIAWDPVSNTFLVTYHELFSAGDFDVKLFRTDLNGNVLGAPFYADFSSVNARFPRVAINQYDRSALVVYTTGDDGDRDIAGNLIDLTSVAGLGARFTISENAADLDLANPDVAGDAYDGADAWFTVVWERIWDANDSDIVLRQVTPTGLLLAEQLVTNFIGVRDDVPSIANIGPGLASHNLVWRRDGNWIHGAQYDFGGFVATAPFAMVAFASEVIVSPPSVSAHGPLIPGDLERSYALAVSIYFPDTNQSDIVLLAYAGDNLVDSAQTTFLEHVDFFEDQRRPVVASSGLGFAMAYEARLPSDPIARTYFTSFEIANRSLAVAERRVLGDLAAGWHYDPRICSLWESGEDGSGFQYGPFAAVTQANGDIVYGALQSYPVCGAQYELCYGNVNSTGERSLLTITGSADDTTSLRTLNVTGLPTHKPGIFIASRTPANPGILPSDSSGRFCLRTPFGRYRQIQNTGSSGTVSLTMDPTAIPLSGNLFAATAGDTWYFQFWHRDTGGGPTSNFSNATGVHFH